MAAINYGTIAVVPKGVWDATTQYNVANLVTYDGSSYLAHSKPPVGTLPTDAAYWQVSAQGTNKATANAAGVVKPDGETITVDTAGTISVDIDKSVKLVGTATGTGIVTIADAYTTPARNLFIYGKSQQDGTPTPDNPVEIVSVGNGGLEIISSLSPEDTTNFNKVVLPVTLRGIGNVRDKLSCRAGVWGIERYLKVHVTDGTDIRKSTTKNVEKNRWDFTIPKAGCPVNYDTRYGCLCSHFNEVTASATWNCVEGFGVTVSPGLTYFYREEWATLTVEELKAIIKVDPITIVIPLATPVWEPLPDAQQAQLNNLTMYNGETACVYITGSKITPEMAVEYYRDTKIIEVLYPDIANPIINVADVDEEFPVPKSGERSRSFFGKVRKFMQDYNDFKAGILTVGMIVNNTITNNSSLPVSAAVAKVLQDQITSLNSDYVSRTTDNTVNSQITLTKSAGINSGSFGAAPLHIRADYANNPNTRAQIGFENSGFNAISLWLDVDGRLKMTDNSGTTKTLAILEDLS